MSKDVRSVLSIVLATVLITAGSTVAYSQARKPAAKPAPKRAPVPATSSPYELGYQQGYGEGFRQGGTDYNRGVPRDLESSEAYQQRDRMYDAKHASNEEYMEGYNLGLELGYADGYYGRTRNQAVPSNGAIIAKANVLAHSQRSRQVTNDQPVDRNSPIDRNPPPDRSGPPDRNSGPVNIPSGTQLNIRLTSPIDTKDNRAGDRFTAEVITPGPYDRARIEGHVASINKSGKVTGRTELALAFDSITLEDGRRADITASLEKIIESETVKEVDEEGNVKSGSRTKDSQVRGGVGAAAGAVIGGIAGGVKGAVLGAIIGGAAGVGTVYIEGNKNLILDPGTEMVIRTERTRAR
ncbi:MAG TPA: hypothetical protein VJZ26_01020 [Blastocatellia bacterium]|nr:hypothetical protein [Blastocatellia bacterium]